MQKLRGEANEQASRRQWLLVFIIDGVMLLLLFAMVAAGAKTWFYYSKTFGARTAENDWLHREVANFSTDVYDEQLTVRRLQIACLRFATGRMTPDEFNLARRQVVSTREMFAPGSILAKAVSGHDAYPIAYASLTTFLEVADRFEHGQASLQEVDEKGQDAAAAWERLTVEANDAEFAARDGMEKAIVEFRPLAVGWLRVTTVLVLLCTSMFAVALWATLRAVRAERRRFDRFEVLLATVGHDLRSPLQALVGAAKLAAADAVPAEREKFVRIVHERSAFFTRLLDDLVNLARSESLAFVPVSINLSEWFEAASVRYRQAVEAKGLQFDVELKTDVPAITFDRHRLTQCVDNLVFNAVRYTDQGKVSLTISCRLTAPGRPDAQLTIEVVDTGRGISAANQARIFEPFVRVDSAVKGMGIGLSMVMTLARRVGGSIDVRSAPGLGSTFTFRAPVTVPSVEAVATLTTSTSRTNERGNRAMTPRILVVDDDPVITLVVSELLPHMGFQADVAQGGLAGLELAKSRDYCAVLTDIQMPDLDGFELAAEIRKAVHPAPRIIAMTAYTSKPLTDPRAKVFDEILSKPVDDDELCSLLDEAATRWATLPHGKPDL